MKIYDYILQTEKIENYDKERKNSARFIVELPTVHEFIIPHKSNKGIFTKMIARKYLKEQLKKNVNKYYVLPTKFKQGIHCIYVEKSEINHLISKCKTLNFDWVSPFYFAMEILELRGLEKGKLYVNIGEYIYRLEIDDGSILSYHCYLKEGYYSSDMKKVDFFKKSIIWIEEETYGFIKPFENNQA